MALMVVPSVYAQIQMGVGSYAQNFDSLGSAAANWTNNLTLTGWYASKANGDATNYLTDTGTSTAGGLRSYGVSGVHSSSDRALGSIGASSINYAYGIRFTNNTGLTQSNVLISYTGEQWRSGASATSPQSLTFSYQLSPSPITNTYTGTWIVFSPLTFISPNLSGSTNALDGNTATNRISFTNVTLSGVSVLPGQELMIRWFDIDDSGFDDGMAIDDFSISFSSSGPTNTPPTISVQPSSQTVNVNDSVAFSVVAAGSAPLKYQWHFNAADITYATNSTLTLNNVTTNQSGNYFVTISNSIGSTNSQIVSLTVVPTAPAVAGFSIMDYNTHGNFVGDWTTNSLQVQAIGRQVQYINPDIITFQEIPNTNAGWTHMGEFTSVYRPGFYLATNSGTDNFIRSAIISRYPIIRSTSWLDGADLDPFGNTNANFTRDLFEAVIAVPGFPQPVHIFTVHLKSGQGTDDSNRRAAESHAISNFFSQVFLTTNSLHTYLLTGDMNEDLNRPPSSNPQSIERLTSTPTGLRLTTPTNLYNGSELTFSIQAASTTKRYDYILPCGLLFSNIASSQVFRSDLVPSPPPPLLATDSETSSDHMPVMMTFNNPYDKPFSLLSVTRSNLTVTLKWQSVPGQPYRVESSTNLATWSTLTGDLIATNTTHTLVTNLNSDARYFRIYRVQ